MSASSILPQEDAHKAVLKSRIGCYHVALWQHAGTYLLQVYSYVWQRKVIHAEEYITDIEVACRSFWRAMRKQWLVASGEHEVADILAFSTKSSPEEMDGNISYLSSG